MSAHHGELASDFAAHFPDLDPYDVLLNPSPAMVRKFYARMRRLQFKDDSEYYAPKRKEAERLRDEREAAARALPDFDEELYRLEQFDLMEQERVKNPLEFFGYSSIDRRLDDLSNEIRLLRHMVPQLAPGVDSSKLPSFRPVQRPGMPITSPDEDDESFIDLDDDDALAAEFAIE